MQRTPVPETPVHEHRKGASPCRSCPNHHVGLAEHVQRRVLDRPEPKAPESVKQLPLGRRGLHFTRTAAAVSTTGVKRRGRFVPTKSSILPSNFAFTVFPM